VHRAHDGAFGECPGLRYGGYNESVVARSYANAVNRTTVPFEDIATRDLGSIVDERVAALKAGRDEATLRELIEAAGHPADGTAFGNKVTDLFLSKKSVPILDGRISLWILCLALNRTSMLLVLSICPKQAARAFPRVPLVWTDRPWIVGRLPQASSAALHELFSEGRGI